MVKFETTLSLPLLNHLLVVFDELSELIWGHLQLPLLDGFLNAEAKIC